MLCRLQEGRRLMMIPTATWNCSFCGSSGRGGTGDAVQELDDAVGQLMAAVKAAGVDDNTIAFFSSGNPLVHDVY